MTDQMPDFDSMSPEEIMKWMEALAVRQGATEGIINDVSDVEVAEIDPSTVDVKDEYIPFGMDPEVWAKKKAEEEARKAEVLAQRNANKPAAPAKPQPAPTPPAQPAAAAPAPQPAAEANPLDFLGDLSAPPTEAAADPLADLFGASAEAAPAAGDGLDFLSDLGAAASSDLGDLDFSGLDALNFDEPAAASGASLDWLESIAGDASAKTIADETPLDILPETEPDVLTETAVGRILDDPMDWLSEAADPAAPTVQAGAPSAADLEALFGAAQGEEPVVEEAPKTEDIKAALKEGSADPENVRAWMDSMLDKGLSRTDVTDDIEDDEGLPIKGEVPSWLAASAPLDAAPDAAPSILPEAEAAPQPLDETDLPEWLTAPVSEDESAEIEAIFADESLNAEPAVPATQTYPATLDNSESLGLLDTGAIQVEMDDPWVEAFELERSEKMGDTDELAEWYTEAQANLGAPTDAVIAAPASGLRPADFPIESDLPHGEPQAVPEWMGGGDFVTVAVSQAVATEPSAPDDLPSWLQPEDEQAAGEEEDELPAWLRTDPEIEPVESDLPPWLAEDPTPEPEESPSFNPADAAPAPAPRRVTGPLTPPSVPRQPTVRVASVSITPSEAAERLKAARGSAKMGDVAASVEHYEVLIRAQAALDEVTSDLANLARDPAHKGNPAVLRVYGDALMRQGNLQAALDTYRAALNLL
jgi:hypothetical protein